MRNTGNQRTNGMLFQKNDFEQLTRCPWCGASKFNGWGRPVRGFIAVKCRMCNLIFIKNRLNENGLTKYYSNYMNIVHQANKVLNQQRQKMYKIEFDFIWRYVPYNSDILDVGCGGGFFLDLFKRNKYRCYGIEFGKAAAKKAAMKHFVWQGEFPNLPIHKRFDAIIFRGVIEHVPYPKEYLAKAVTLLKKHGIIYITSTPNAAAFCCELFKEKWNQHVPEPHLMHFCPQHFDEYFAKAGFTKRTEYFFYEETPYANPKQDILKVAKAIMIKKTAKRITFSSPAFWGNMMSLVYQKKF